MARRMVSTSLQIRFHEGPDGNGRLSDFESMGKNPATLVLNAFSGVEAVTRLGMRSFSPSRVNGEMIIFMGTDVKLRRPAVKVCVAGSHPAGGGPCGSGALPTYRATGLLPAGIWQRPALRVVRQGEVWERAPAPLLAQAVGLAPDDRVVEPWSRRSRFAEART